MIQINEWLPAVVCVINFGATIIQKPVKEQSDSLEMNRMCQIGT